MKNSKHKMKKSLGQNFLRDEKVIEDIINAAMITKGDVIFEIGPGDGALTKKLVETGARVIALEVDKDLVVDLQKKYAQYTNCTILHQDVRRFNLPAYLEKEKITSYKVVANLPYYITSSIIRFFLESETPPKDMTIMVQKEVAERITAKSGKLSVLGISVQYFAMPEIVMTVPAEAFDPVPQVESAVLHIKEIQKYGSRTKKYTKKFFQIVRIGFSARRKMLLKNLTKSTKYEKEQLQEICTHIGIAPTARAQELTLKQWHKLTQNM